MIMACPIPQEAISTSAGFDQVSLASQGIDAIPILLSRLLIMP